MPYIHQSLHLPKHLTPQNVRGGLRMLHVRFYVGCAYSPLTQERQRWIALDDASTSYRFEQSSHGAHAQQRCQGA